jgi:hypothetical protein
MAKSIRLDIEGISGKTYELLVLDRNDRIENVVNCVIVRKNEDFKTLSVTFPDNFGRIVYVPMEIQLYIKKNRK